MAREPKVPQVSQPPKMLKMKRRIFRLQQLLPIKVQSSKSNTRRALKFESNGNIPNRHKVALYDLTCCMLVLATYPSSSTTSFCMANLCGEVSVLLLFSTLTKLFHWTENESYQVPNRAHDKHILCCDMASPLPGSCFYL